MNRDNRPLLFLSLAGGFVLFLLVTVGPLLRGRGHPMDLYPGPPGPQDNRPDVPPAMKVAHIETALRDSAPDLRVPHRSGSANCLVIGPDVDPATLDALLPTEEFADCWRGVVLCEADWAVLQPDEAATPDGPHACRVGDFRLFGDLQLTERIRPAAVPFPRVAKTSSLRGSLRP